MPRNVGLEIGGHEGGGPVVGVDQLGAEVEPRDRFEHGAGEEHEPLAVVLVVFAALAVELGAVVVAVLLRRDRRARSRRPGACCGGRCRRPFCGRWALRR